MDSPNKDIGTRIRAIRRQLKMTQEDLGKILGIEKASISKYEAGETKRGLPSEFLVKIAELGKVSLDWLLTGSEKPAGWVVAVSPEDLGYPPVQDDDEERCEPEQCNETEAGYVTLEASREEAMILAHIRELPARDVRLVKETVEGLWFDNKSKQEKKQRKKDLENPENL